MRSTTGRVLVSTSLLLLAALLAGCGAGGSGGSSGSEEARADGYAEQARARADRLASLLVPAAVQDLGAQVFPGLARYQECQLTGWSYVVTFELFGPDLADDAVAPLLEEQGLTLEPRDDGRVVGRDGSLSVLVDRDTGGRRPVTLTEACTRYSDADVEVAEGAERTDVAGLVPPGALYAPGS